MLPVGVSETFSTIILGSVYDHAHISTCYNGNVSGAQKSDTCTVRTIPYLKILIHWESWVIFRDR